MGGEIGFGIAIPQGSDAGSDPATLRRFLARAEDLPYSSAWVLEQPIGVAPTLDPLSLLAFAAAVTDRLRLCTAVILTPLRTPVGLAKALATVDRLSGGRLIAGLGLGGQPEHYPAFGLAPEGRVRRFEEAVRLLMLLWSEPSVTFQGEFWQLEGVSVAPTPVQRPRPPVWFGGSAPPALRRAARMADGWIGAGSSRTADLAGSVRTLREELEAQGRDAASFALAKRVYVAVDADVTRARDSLSTWFQHFYGDSELAAQVAVAGPVDACIAGLAQVAEAGVRLIVVNPVDDHERQAQILAEEVLPHLSGWPDGGT